MQPHVVTGRRCYAIVFLSLLVLSLTDAYGQDDPQTEYQSILELTLADAPEMMPKGWSIVTGDDASGVAVEDSALWRVEADGSGISFMPKTQPLSLVSPVLLLDAACTTLSGVILGKGSNKVEAQIRWMSKDAVVSVEPLREPPVSNEATRRFNLPETERQENIDAVQLLLTVHPDNTERAFLFNTVNLTGGFSFSRSVTLLCNKIGYEQVGPKKFTVRANFTASTAVFTLSDTLGTKVSSGELSPAAPMKGATGGEWKDYYYRGDFYTFEEEGNYTLTVELDECTPVSVPVHIGFDRLLDEAFAPTLAPFKRLRLASSDTADILQLWDPAFAGHATDAALLWDIVRSWSILRGRLYGNPAFIPLDEEALYGLERVAQWVIEHGNAGSEDIVQETFYAASLACGAHFYSESATLLHGATILAENTISKNLEGILPFSIVMDMYEATREAHYLEYAQRIFPGISVARVEPLLDYEGYTGEMASIKISNMFDTLAARILKNAQNPFGLTQAITEGQKGFFLWEPESQEPLKGGTTRILGAVEIMAQAYRYTANLEYRAFIYDQLNWILGNNPYDVCLIAGLCSPDMPPVILPEGWTPTDAHGFVLNGIGPCKADTDTPLFAVEADELSENTNGFSLYNNARYISAMAYLKRIPTARPLKASL